MPPPSRPPSAPPGWGCLDPIALNYNSAVSIDADNCRYQYAYGKVTMLGYLEECVVYIDIDDDMELDNVEQQRQSDTNGFFSVPYTQPAAVRVLPSHTQCIDTFSGFHLSVALETTVNATMASALTTVATMLIGRNSTDGEPMDEASAGHLACMQLTSCIPCDGGCCNACSLHLKKLSVFTFDALDYMVGDFYDPAWLGWPVGNSIAIHSVECAKHPLLCASPEICDTSCDEWCGSVGAHTTMDVESALWATMADMAEEKKLVLYNQTGEHIAELMQRAAARLGTELQAWYHTKATSCASDNWYIYNSFVLNNLDGRSMMAKASNVRQVTSAQSVCDKFVTSYSSLTDLNNLPGGAEWCNHPSRDTDPVECENSYRQWTTGEPTPASILFALCKYDAANSKCRQTFDYSCEVPFPPSSPPT